eukprot:CAMPEP_0177239736 /NCGR_PEP_ID=MMETSP0367-20130122/47300_1 /TAXON_ID=447022 ORGANISM="Scrippsiella hangoei-like, Strain SHHI-4" /NCGR_SAMPLE_ID=MMETSP0367 /ASSEMBLY_ACC=CAM_ASM_000362 /LENGTH=51 /DNA_ID=CAMNT_0018691039 /DNA_START=92 /DNA_END=244 /DNA_ORIENTATION=-
MYQRAATCMTERVGAPEQVTSGSALCQATELRRRGSSEGYCLFRRLALGVA